MLRQLVTQDLLNPLSPARLKLLLLQLGLLLIGDACVLDAIQRQLLEVPKVELPGAHGIKVVEGDALVAEQAGVVGRD